MKIPIQICDDYTVILASADIQFFLNLLYKFSKMMYNGNVKKIHGGINYVNVYHLFRP
jgi:hypothetical protein